MRSHDEFELLDDPLMCQETRKLRLGREQHRWPRPGLIMEKFTGVTTRNRLGLVDLLVETIIVSHLCGPNLKNECTFRSFSLSDVFSIVGILFNQLVPTPVCIQLLCWCTRSVHYFGGFQVVFRRFFCMPLSMCNPFKFRDIKYDGFSAAELASSIKSSPLAFPPASMTRSFFSP